MIHAPLPRLALLLLCLPAACATEQHTPPVSLRAAHSRFPKKKILMISCLVGGCTLAYLCYQYPHCLSTLRGCCTLTHKTYATFPPPNHQQSHSSPLLKQEIKSTRPQKHPSPPPPATPEERMKSLLKKLYKALVTAYKNDNFANLCGFESAFQAFCTKNSDEALLKSFHYLFTNFGTTPEVDTIYDLLTTKEEQERYRTFPPTLDMQKYRVAKKISDTFYYTKSSTNYLTPQFINFAFLTKRSRILRIAFENNTPNFARYFAHKLSLPRPATTQEATLYHYYANECPLYEALYSIAGSMRVSCLPLTFPSEAKRLAWIKSIEDYFQEPLKEIQQFVQKEEDRNTDYEVSFKDLATDRNELFKWERLYERYQEAVSILPEMHLPTPTLESLGLKT